MAVVLAWLGTIGLNAVVGLAAYLVAKHGWRQPPGFPRGLAALVLAWTWVTLGMEILGAVGSLSWSPLFAWSAAGLAVGLVLRGFDRSRTARAASPDAEFSWEGSAVVALGIFLWGALFLGMNSLITPVKVVSDGPIYHLYFAAKWWKAGRVFLIATPFGENAATYFPAVGDLWYTWLMVGWGGERLAKVGQAPFLLVAGAAAYALARRLGAGRSSALIATTWFLSVSPFFLFSFEPNVDTMFVAGYLLAAYFFLRYALGDDGLPSLALGALAAGASLGCKAVGVVFIPPLLVLAVLAVVRSRRPVRHVVAGLGLLVLMPLVPAGYWYGRNAVLTGNPLYPLRVSAFGRVWLDGWYDRGVMRFSMFYLPAGDWRSMVDLFLAILDPRLAPLWVAALLGAWGWGRAREVGSRGWWVWGFSLLAVANVALFWMVIPYRSQQRFMLQALGVWVVPLALTFERARWLRWAAACLLGLHIFTSQNWPYARAGERVFWDLAPVVPNGAPRWFASRRRRPGIGPSGSARRPPAPCCRTASRRS